MTRPKLTRARARFASGEYFARVPRQVMESEAYRCLPDWARSNVFALAAQYRGKGNGDLSLTWQEARALGISSEWKLRAGLKLSEYVGLIVLTRPGGNIAGGEKKPNLYALGWLPIEHSEKYQAPPGTLLKAPDGWATWTRTDDWKRIVDSERQRAQGKNPHHTSVRQPATHGGSNSGNSGYTRKAQQRPVAATHGRETSKDSGWDRDGAAIKLIESQPHLNDFDVSRALGWAIEPGRVRALRERQRA